MIHQAGLLFCFTMLRRRVFLVVVAWEAGASFCVATPLFFVHTTRGGIPGNCQPSSLFKLAVDDMYFDG